MLLFDFDYHLFDFDAFSGCISFSNPLNTWNSISIKLLKNIVVGVFQEGEYDALIWPWVILRFKYLHSKLILLVMVQMRGNLAKYLANLSHKEKC